MPNIRSRRLSRGKIRYPCSYLRCTQSFGTRRQLSLHESAHEADKPHRCVDCGARFTTTALMKTHIRRMHERENRGKKRRRQDRDLGVVEEEEKRSGIAEEENLDGREEDEEALEEAREIRDNGVYLMSQMRVARSYGIGTWEKQDFLNAHLWAVWVQGAVEDFSDLTLLTRVLNASGLKIEALRHAERVFFDSVVGFEGLSSDMVLHMIEAVMNRQEKGKDEDEDEDEDGKEKKQEKDEGESDEELSQQEASMDALVGALAAAVERKRTLWRLDAIVQQLDKVLDRTEGIREDQQHEAVAKGDVLLRQHMRMGAEGVRAHLKKVGTGNGCDGEMIRVIGEEARMASGDVRVELFKFLEKLLESKGAVVVRGLDGMMGRLCARDVEFLDSYLSWLLTRVGDGGRKNDKVMGMVAEGKISVRRGAEEIGNGGVSVSGEEVGRWIRELVETKGIVGYISRIAVEEYQTRTRRRIL